MAEAARQQVITALKAVGGGSILRGWRVELDPDGSLDVNFLEFCKAASNLQITCDIGLLFGEDSPNELELCELVPAEARLVERFRKWLTDEFGGPGEMFAAMEPQDGSNEGRLSRQEFTVGCRRNGFQGSKSELGELFNLLDLNCLESIMVEDVMFLDLDPKRREGAIKKAKERAKIDHEHLLTEFYRHLKKQGHPEGHRLAPRGWHAPQLERLPEVVIEKRIQWRKKEKQRRIELFDVWQKKMTATYGTMARAWRRGLDRGAKFTVTRAEFGQFCRRLNLDVDIATLWMLVDNDGDDALTLADISPQGSASLARFCRWQKDSFGSTTECWNAIFSASKPAPNWKSTVSLKSPVFSAAIKALQWPGSNEQGAGATLCTNLDLNGCGIVSKADLEWLDRWDPPEWLWKQADHEAWAQLSGLMLYHYERPLRAWRLFDKDDSNQVSWDEFTQGCDLVGFQGNRGGAWRAIDLDVSGTISMAEWHKPSADLLSSFKDWMDDNFGSVKFGFKAMDSDNSGTLSFSELKRACRLKKWDGDVREIFECLNVSSAPGQRSLSYKGLQFLDSWEPSLDNLAQQPTRPTSKEGQRRDSKSGVAPAPSPTAAARAAPVDKGGKSKLAKSASCPAAAANGMLGAAPAKAGERVQLPRVTPPGSPIGSVPVTPMAKRQPVTSSRRGNNGIGCRRDEILASMRVENHRIHGENCQAEEDHKELQSRTTFHRKQSSLPALQRAADARAAAEAEDEEERQGQLYSAEDVAGIAVF